MGRSHSWDFPVWHLSLFMSVWGLSMMLPFGTFDGSESYAVMEAFASEFAWGLSAFTMGLSKSHLIALKKRISLSVFCLIAGGFWLLVGIMIMLAAPTSLAAILYISLGLLDLWFWARLRDISYSV